LSNISFFSSSPRPRKTIRPWSLIIRQYSSSNIYYLLRKMFKDFCIGGNFEQKSYTFIRSNQEQLQKKNCGPSGRNWTLWPVIPMQRSNHWAI
jgi:hypothetical protein